MPGIGSRATAPLITAVALACGGGGEGAGDGPASAHTVRDSAGIEIVENHRPAWPEGEAWRLSGEPVYRILGADGGEENLLLDPASIDVDSRGRIIIADGNQVGWDAVLVYDSLGGFEFRAGGPGEGPGEFGQLWWASSYRGDSIVGFDMSGDEVAVFDPGGRFARQVRTPALQTPSPPQGTIGFTAGMDAAYGDGHFLAYPLGTFDVPDEPGPGWLRHRLLRLAPDGESWDTLGTFEIGQQHWDGSTQEQLWFGPYAVKAVGEDVLYFGRGDAFQIGRYDGAGRLTRIIRRTWEPRPVTDEWRSALRDWYLERMSSSPEASDEVLERVRQRFETGRFAEALPAYSHAFVDDLGYLWVEEFRWMGVERSPVPGPARWSVFDSAGVWQAVVETPPGFILREATRDRALGFVVDELDVKEVEVYEIERPAG